ncbi:LamG-like jellyroll fold domain-containing protein [Bowdeniella massiliensis]|uniref:LamG-like jellyroll fold domain-containing protein n=1 Tax=Bowdeniella massiliensis TaxID=2932264 RepID=UPI002028E2C1|nr:LamG-like jellyroll fold domain-containing protein [Bowdeniella massiliensis]
MHTFAPPLSAMRALIAGAAAVALALLALISPLLRAHATPLAPPAETVSAPDVLDVDFARKTASDAAQGFHAKTIGGAAFLADPDLGHTVATFDGNDDALHYESFARAWTDDALVRPTTAFTQQCKFRYTGGEAPADPQFVCRVNNTGGFAIYITGTELTANFQSTTKNDWIGSQYKPGEWVDAVQTYDGTTWALYLDGKLATTKKRDGQVRVPSAGNRAYTLADSPVNKDWNFEGDIAATRVWSRALSASEVTALAAGNVAQPDTGSAKIVPDANVLDVDLSRGTADDQAQGLAASAKGKVALVEDSERGTIARFDGVDSAYHYEDFPKVWTDASYTRPTQSFTQQCTFKYTGEEPPSGPQYVCRVNNPGGFGFYIDGPALTVNLHTDKDNNWISGTYAPGDWVDAVQTYDGELWTLYIDGEVAATAKRTGNIRVPSGASQKYTLGDAPANAAWFFEGDIAASRVWDTALTPYQVKALHEGSADVPEVDVVDTTPARGAHLTSEVVFDVRVTGAEAARNWSYTLDGEPISPGTRIGADLAAGAHEIVITAVGPRGENLKWRIPFTSEAMPTGGGIDTGQGQGTVTLSAIASNPHGGDVTTTFNEADISLARDGFQGVIPAIPETLDFDYTDGKELSGEHGPDGNLLESPVASDRRLVFQRFDVPVEPGATHRDVVWNGLADPQRSVSLWAWHDERAEWVKLTSARGAAEGDTHLRGSLRDGFHTGGTLRLMVIGEDPFADDLSPRDKSANLPENRDHFEEPTDYDFALAHISDTQNIAQIVGNVCPQYNPKAEGVMRQAYTDLTTWIASNAKDRKIAFTGHTGDIIESKMTSYPALCAKNAEQVTAEFEFTSEMQRILDDAGLVNTVLPGNHDNTNGTDNGPDTEFNSFFGADRYYEAAKAWPEGASYHPWDEELDENGTVVKAGKDNDNHYVLFSAGGLDFVAVSLGFIVTEEEAAWASSIFTKYADRSGILLTHAYLGASSQPDGRSASYTADGGLLSKQVVDTNPNVFLVLAGHVHGVGTNVKGDAGVSIDRRHGVVEILADYQEYRVPAGKVWPDKLASDGTIDLDGDGKADYKEGDGIILGASFLRLLQIDTKSSTMSVDTYSPYLDNFGATEFDRSNRYNGAEDNFTVPIDLPTRTTSIATDGLAVVTPTDRVIGEATAKSGWPASVQWSGLSEGELYAWTATSRDASGTILGEVHQFGGIFRATAAGTDTEPPVLKVPGAVSIVAGESFDPLAGVSALDNTDGDITDRIQVTGSVDTETPGAYALHYLVADANGNQATALRAVTVTEADVPDPTPGPTDPTDPTPNPSDPTDPTPDPTEPTDPTPGVPGTPGGPGGGSGPGDGGAPGGGHHAPRLPVTGADGTAELLAALAALVAAGGAMVLAARRGGLVRR